MADKETEIERMQKLRSIFELKTSDIGADESLPPLPKPNDYSEQALDILLSYVMKNTDPKELNMLSDRIERHIFRKQFQNG